MAPWFPPTLPRQLTASTNGPVALRGTGQNSDRDNHMLP